MSKINWKILVICLVIVYAIAFIGSLFTTSVVSTEWYNSIKPSITPPNYIFPLVWNILFFLIAVSLYLSWMNSKEKQKSKIAWVFGINLFLNVLWSLFFFSMKNPLMAFIDLIFLWISIWMMIFTTWKINRASSYLLIPYLLWVTFAGVLNWLMI